MLMQSLWLYQRSPKKVGASGSVSFHIAPAVNFFPGVTVSDGVFFGITSPFDPRVSRFTHDWLLLSETIWLEWILVDRNYVFEISAKTNIPPST